MTITAKNHSLEFLQVESVLRVKANPAKPCGIRGGEKAALPEELFLFCSLCDKRNTPSIAITIQNSKHFFSGDESRIAPLDGLRAFGQRQTNVPQLLQQPTSRG